MPGRLRIVGHQPEPKLIASRQMTKAIRDSRSASGSGNSSWAGASAVTNPAAYGSIASAAIWTDRARSATRAQAARTRSETVSFPAIPELHQIPALLEREFDAVRVREAGILTFSLGSGGYRAGPRDRSDERRA